MARLDLGGGTMTRIKYRSLWKQVLLTIVTLGLYPFYWFHVINVEMCAYLKREENIFLWTLFFGFPPLCFYSCYKQGELYEQISQGEINRWLLFVLWIVFPPAVWFILQKRMNEIALQTSAAIAS